MSTKQKLKIIPLGGMNEIGKNMTLFEYGNDILVLDCGLAFPDEDMLGIDLVIPDACYLVKNADKVRGIVLTHGHEDHIGALPYVLKDVNVPVYGTKLTNGIVMNKIKEHRLQDSVKLNNVKPGDVIKLGCFKIEFINVNHSIPAAVAVAIRTPVGTLFHTGDFKIDTTPIDGDMINLGRIAEIGKEGVLLLMSESTNVERPGFTMSERTVGAALDDIFKDCTKRIIVATFASNVHRVQQIINAAHRTGRKVAVSGRSMENVAAVATELGYIKVPPNTMISLDSVSSYTPDQLVIITTGSQGEPMSALSRMAYSDHRKVIIGHNDLVIISANPIPGNEKFISRVINELFKKGADVIYESLADVHVSGHACQEELKLMFRLVNPKFFMPVHGEFRHLKQHAKLASSLGMSEDKIFISDIGKVLELDSKSAKWNGNVPSGKIMVDGLGVGDVGNIVMRDRKHLAQDGLIVVVVIISGDSTIVAGPDIISRGFVYVREAESLMEDARLRVKNTLDACEEQGFSDWSTLKSNIKNSLGSFLYEKTKRKPMILPIIMEI